MALGKGEPSLRSHDFFEGSDQGLGEGLELGEFVVKLPDCLGGIAQTDPKVLAVSSRSQGEECFITGEDKRAVRPAIELGTSPLTAINFGQEAPGVGREKGLECGKEGEQIFFSKRARRLVGRPACEPSFGFIGISLGMGAEVFGIPRKESGRPLRLVGPPFMSPCLIVVCDQADQAIFGPDIESESGSWGLRLQLGESPRGGSSGEMVALGKNGVPLNRPCAT